MTNSTVPGQSTATLARTGTPRTTDRTEAKGELANGEPTAAPSSRGTQRWRQIRSYHVATAWIALVALVAVLEPLLPFAGATDRIGPNRQAPGWRWLEFLGLDANGRSLLTFVVVGMRQSFFIAATGAAIALVLGTTLGMLAGYLGGRVDKLISVLIDVALAFPSLILILVIMSIFGPSIPSLLVALSLVATPTFARLARANTRRVKQLEFVHAARVMGASHVRIILREVLPNIFTAVVSYAFISMAILVVFEGSLSFIGLGLQPPSPSLGGMIAAGRHDLAWHPHLTFVPGLALLSLVLALNKIGDRWRRRLNVKDTTL